MIFNKKVSALKWHTANNFLFMYSKNYFWCQLNISKKRSNNVMSWIMIFCREVVSILGKTHFQQNYVISELQEIYISRLELQRSPLAFVISFSEVQYIFGILDWGLASSFWNYEIQISLKKINFSIYFSNNYFWGTVICPKMDFYIWFCQAHINSTGETWLTLVLLPSSCSHFFIFFTNRFVYLLL